MDSMLIIMHYLSTLKLLTTFWDKQSVYENTFGCRTLWIVMMRNNLMQLTKVCRFLEPVKN